MKKITFAAAMGLSIFILGCSTPKVISYNQIYSYTKKIEKKKVAMGGTQKTETTMDFRLNVAYDEDIDALKQKVEKYISKHTELSDAIKGDLRELKVTAGLIKEQVELLLGKPDKAARADSSKKYNATEVWIYKINKMRMFSVFIMPVLPISESYCLYFSQDTLAGIEGHSLKQAIQIGAGPGLEMKRK